MNCTLFQKKSVFWIAIIWETNLCVINVQKYIHKYCNTFYKIYLKKNTNYYRWIYEKRVKYNNKKYKHKIWIAYYVE